MLMGLQECGLSQPEPWVQQITAAGHGPDWPLRDADAYLDNKEHAIFSLHDLAEPSFVRAKVWLPPLVTTKEAVPAVLSACFVSKIIERF
jgi:hypothetical protein